MKLRIYVAAPWSERAYASVIAAGLLANGHIVTSRWHSIHADTNDPDVLQQEAGNDLDDVFQSDVFLLLNTQKRGEETSGKAFETGYAYANGVQVLVVGERTNVFHYLEDVLVVANIGEALDVLNQSSVPTPA